MEELFFEADFDMPISDPTADKLINRIDKLVKAIEGKQEGSNDPTPIVRIEKDLTWHARIGWIAISVTATALVTLFSFVLLRLPRTADVQNAVSTAFNSEVSPLNDKISAISEKLAVLTATMEFLKPDVSKNLPKVMKQSLQQKGDLELGLKTLVALTTKAQEQRITTDPVAIEEVVRDLLSIKNRNADFWRASTSLLNYRSFDMSPKQTADLSISSLPNCTNSKPQPFRITQVGPKGDVEKFSNPYYENCLFTLDSAEDDARINSMVMDGFPVIEFRHCLIVYKGGDFTLVSWIHMENASTWTSGKGRGLTLNFNGPTLWFTGCLFDFSVSSQTPEPGKEIMQALLSQTGMSLGIPLGNPASSSPPTHN